MLFTPAIIVPHFRDRTDGVLCERGKATIDTTLCSANAGDRTVIVAGVWTQYWPIVAFRLLPHYLPVSACSLGG